MEYCIVCLEARDAYDSRISMVSSELIEGKVLRIIEKHLWWWYLKPMFRDNGVVQYICHQCWQAILTFHHFYNKVEMAHRCYNSMEIFAEGNNKTALETFNINLEPNISEESLNIDMEGIKNEYCNSNDSDSIQSVSANTSSKNSFYIKQFENNNSNEMLSTECDSIIHDANVMKSPEETKRKTDVKKIMESNVMQVKENSKCEPDRYDNILESQQKLECSICNATLCDFRSLGIHFRREHNKTGYAMCCGNKFFRRSVYYDHLKVHVDPNFFKCKCCHKSFSSRRTLKIHLKTHEKRERKYNCDECGKSFFNVQTFNRHTLTHASGSEKVFNCSKCDKKFASCYMRQQHEDVIHAKKYARTCEICEKSFCNSSAFMRHKHNIRSMVKCGTCGEKLLNERIFEEHMKRQHMEQNRQKPVCPYCSIVSSNFRAHRKHMQHAHKHVCRLCDKAFQRSVEFKNHLSSHTVEAIYTCPYCIRKFTSNARMHAHQKIAHRKEWEEVTLKEF